MNVLPRLYEATIVKRPSATCKSPYVADIILKNGQEIVIAHSPALGCGGLSDKDAIVLVSKLENSKGICKYRIELGINEKGTIIGLNPKIAENLVEEYIMKSEKVRKYKREYTLLNSRFDFIGIDARKEPFVLEVKTVPLLTKNGIAHFPHGNRKKKGESVSPRAVKHLDDLIQISKTSKTRPMMCYVIQRDDTDTFIPSHSDPVYKKKFNEAFQAGVIMKTIFVSWKKTGICEIKSYKDYML